MDETARKRSVLTAAEMLKFKIVIKIPNSKLLCHFLSFATVPILKGGQTPT